MGSLYVMDTELRRLGKTEVLEMDDGETFITT